MKNTTMVSELETLLFEGKLAESEAALQAKIAADASDDSSRFGLGIVQFLQAVERLSQDLSCGGFRTPSDGMGIRLWQLPIAGENTSETMTYTRLRQIAQTLLDNLTRAETSLSTIQDPEVKVPLHFGMIKMDLNGDGRVEDDETFWKVYAAMTGSSELREKKARDFLIVFDRGDVHWLRGYCHLLSTVCELYLAHDSQEAFERTGHLFFNKTDSPYQFMRNEKAVMKHGWDELLVLDMVALIHLIHCNVVEPNRMASALRHLEAVVAQSKESWKWIMAETDDDHEWLPNPRQTGVIPNVRVTEEMVSAWLSMMDQAGDILAGKLLLPYWRGDRQRGINLRRVFLEPQTFDLVLWVQGTAAVPYLEYGRITSVDSWTRLPRVFGQHFPGFALWFN
ncbi:MAG TPA: hypothetical protein V6C72_08220 [Chroococcales cyanobacterium]